jgi:alpha-galactosidase
MGWNMFGETINAEIVKQIAEAFVSSGLREAGYQYVVIDDHWHGGRGADGRLFPDRQ